MTPVNEVKAAKLTKAQHSLLEIVESWNGITKAALPSADWRRLDALSERGLVQSSGLAIYEITPAGRAALQQSAGFQVSQSQPCTDGTLPVLKEPQHLNGEHRDE